MIVKDVIDSMHNPPGSHVHVVVKPKGTTRKYFDSDTNLRSLMDKEVENAEVRNWFVCGMRRDKCDVVLIVDRNKEYEDRLDSEWRRLIEK